MDSHQPVQLRVPSFIMWLCRSVNTMYAIPDSAACRPCASQGSRQRMRGLFLFLLFCWCSFSSSSGILSLCLSDFDIHERCTPILLPSPQPSPPARGGEPEFGKDQMCNQFTLIVTISDCLEKQTIGIPYTNVHASGIKYEVNELERSREEGRGEWMCPLEPIQASA